MWALPGASLRWGEGRAGALSGRHCEQKELLRRPTSVVGSSDSSIELQASSMKLAHGITVTRTDSVYRNAARVGSDSGLCRLQ